MENIQEAYSDFAFVYDEFMDETPYEAWASYIHEILLKDGIKDGLLLDLGCGTGVMTRIFREKGYDMIGVDASYDMLTVARENGTEGILYLCQDMREFELYGTVRAIFSVCDCINYILQEDELVQVFRLVNNYLDPGGLFIFDFNTIYKYRDVIGDCVIAENRENCSFIWENSFEEETAINMYALTVFQRDEGELLYRKCVEEHLQRGYVLDEIKALLKEAGLIFINAFDTDTKDEVTDKSERVTVIAKEQGK